jgi:mannan endo-1,4-beta-mannosidase
MKRFKKSFMLFLTFVMVVTMMAPVLAFGKGSDNLSLHWAGESIEKWRDNKVVQGYPDGSFKPDNKITRAELVSVINKLFGFSAKSQNSFSDIPVGAWYADELSIAKQAGYYKGFSNNESKAVTYVTRQDAATLFTNAFSLGSDGNTVANNFGDFNQVSAYAQEAVNTLKDVLSGYPDGTFRPNASITRAEVVTIIDRLIGGYYNATGSFVTTNIQGNVLVNKSDVVLKDAVISGNLYLSAGIGIGDASLENVTVKGTTFVSGGGENSIHIKDSKLGKVQVNRTDGKVRVVLEGSTVIDQLLVVSPTHLELGSGVTITLVIIGNGAKGTIITGQGRIVGLNVQTTSVTLNGKLLDQKNYIEKDLNETPVGSSNSGTPSVTSPNNGGDTSTNPGSGTQNDIVHIVDTKATAQTRSLFAYLNNMSGKQIMFGHQHDTTVSFAGKDENGNVISDVFSSTGDYPAVFGWDTLALDGYEAPPGVSGNYEASRLGLTAAMKHANDLGGIVTLSTHPYNFATNGSFNDTSNTKGATKSVATRILPGGDKNAEFNIYLNRIANFANNLKSDDGNLIPVLFRPFHEQNGSWFWWGAGTTTKSEYTEVYRYTVEYLRDVKDVHNFLYVFSPNGTFSGNEQEYLTTYPGDQYVDILGMDQYDSKENAGSEAFLNGMVKDLKMISKLADVKKKIVTFSEYGYSAAGMKTTGNNDIEWFTRVLNAIKADPDAKKISYMLTWANFGEGNNLYVPYKNVPNKEDHELLPDFVKFYKDSYTAFASNIKNDNKYGIATVAAVKEPFLHIVSPTNVGTVTEASIVIRAKVSNTVPSKVTYTINDSAEIEMTLDADGYYSASWEPVSMLNGGDASIVVKAYGSDSSVLEQTISVFVKVNEILIKKFGFDNSADVEQIRNNGTYPDTIKTELKHALLDTDGKLAIEITEGLSAGDTWQELKLQLNDLSGISLSEVKRVKFDVLIPVSAQNADSDAAVSGVVMLPEDWNTKFGGDSTKKSLSELDKVTIDGEEYFIYNVSVDLDNAEVSAEATGLAISIVGSGLVSEGVLPIYVDNIALYSTYVAPVSDAALVDNFESYGTSDDALAAKYPKAGGDDISVSLNPDHKSSGNYGMELHYDINSAGYTGIGKNMGSVDWSDYNGLNLWISSDGINSFAKEGKPLKLVIQLAIEGGNYELYPVIQPDQNGKITLKLKDLVFAHSGTGGVITEEKLEKVTSFRIYVNTTDSQPHEGTLYFDDIQAIYDLSLPDLSDGEGPTAHSPGVLYSFNQESDIVGWVVNGAEAKALPAVYSDVEKAISTQFDLKNTGIKTDGSENYIESVDLSINPEGLNLTGLDTISAKVKLSNGTARARLFIKTGNWTWSDSGTNVTIKNTDYTTLSIDLQTAATVAGVDLTQVKSVGIMIDNLSNDGISANLYLQEIALASNDSIAPVVNYGFENGVEGWSMGSGIVTVSKSVYSAGANSLMVQFNAPSSDSEFIATSVNASVDLSSYTKLIAKVKIVSDVPNIRAKLFLQLRGYKVFLDSGVQTTSEDGFTQFSINLSNPENIYVGTEAPFTAADLKLVDAIGIQFLAPADTNGSVTAYIDEVYVSK